MNYESTLADGTRVLFRPISPEDKGRLQEGLRRLSPESRYRRFFRYIEHFTEEQLVYLTELDFENHFAWIAVLPDETGQPGVGVGRWIRLAEKPTLAEGAVTVLDDYQGKGIGSTLLWLLARSAVEKGINYFVAYVTATNRPMLALLEELGAQELRWQDGIAEVRTPLPSDPSELDLSPAPLILRAVARGEFAAASPVDRPSGATMLEPPEQGTSGAAPKKTRNAR
jgi:GNAT superfamily N-acetyltransferase